MRAWMLIGWDHGENIVNENGSAIRVEAPKIPRWSSFVSALELADREEATSVATKAAAFAGHVFGCVQSY